MSARSIVHLVLHALVPAVVAWGFFRSRWKTTWLILLSGWLIDVDHLLARPLYDPARCSIGFHPLHTAPLIALYFALLVPRPTRLFALGLVIHIALDALDCILMAE